MAIHPGTGPLVKTALTLGKFAPLHKGHQLVIERALAESDRVVTMIYDAPSTTSCPLPIRADWIRRLYPQVEVIEAWNGPEEVGETPAIMRAQEDFLLATLGERRISHFYSSEFYGEHVSRALGAIDCRVDPERNEVPVSGTEIRRDTYRQRHYLDPLVYADLITRIVLVGAPSTGKTTLAEALAARFETKWMPEYGREYWQRHQVNRRLTAEQLVEIATQHRQQEDALVLEANRFLFVDTDATSTRMFALDYHGSVDPHLDALADESRDRYDLHVLCEDDIPYDDTEDRSGPAQRSTMQKKIRADLVRRKIPFIAVTGTAEQRLGQLSDFLDRFDKFAPLGPQIANSSQVPSD